MSTPGWKLISYNICFNNQYLVDRTLAIIDILLGERPLIICLQEVTPESLLVLQTSPFIRQYYHIYAPSLPINPYGVAILYFKGIDQASLTTGRLSLTQTQMGREMIYLDFIFQGERYVVGTVHLESVFKPSQRPIKYRQLRQALEKLENQYPYATTHLIMAGDFNISESEEVNIKFTEAELGWNDVWKETGSQATERYTFDHSCNNLVSGRYRSRLDRFYCKSPLILAKDFHLIGRTNVSELKIPPSDHFGLSCQITIQHHK